MTLTITLKGKKATKVKDAICSYYRYEGSDSQSATDFAKEKIEQMLDKIIENHEKVLEVHEE